ncbi:hypothetical protein [Rhizobium aegyptiacum]|uniref:hypothetical protein n=1 Tax=Rhizobium aegyptiacum TaxID=1764550 RepID=UPI0007E59CFC|nr:hypothetical protein [Rhizobium aegyptiacum]
MVSHANRFETGNLVLLNFTNRGSYEAIVLDRHLLPAGPNGGPAVTLLFYDEGAPHIITLSEKFIEVAA